MIAMKQDCLAADDIRRVIEGGLPVDEFESAVAHLDDCDKCRSAAESLQDASALVDSDPADIDAIQNETACQAAVQALLQTPAAELTPTAQITPRSKLGPYVLSGSLGSGGMSTVMLGQHERLKRDCAIKLLPRERVHTPGWLDRFEREMAAVAALEHPNIVRATDAGHEDGWHYLVMEHLDGLDVGRVARRSGPLAIADACEIVRQAAQGLSAIHASGLVHRDIKPSNLMLTRAGVVKVLDLGLVLGGDDPICVDDRLTTVGHLMGTVAFMSPEQLADSSSVDARADLYSLGATLYRLIAGRTPHQRQGGLAKQILAITSQDATPIRTIRPEVPAEVAELIDELLSRDPAARPSSADDVAQRLAAAARGSRLKKLVATALLTPEDPDASRVTAMPAAATPPPKSPWAKRFSMAMGGAAILIAALIFKIKTDVGDLIVHSEQDGLTLVVTRDAKVVDRLKIETTKQNKFTLSKGTYRIAIEGGGSALKLSEEVVTIGRGATVPVEVESSASQPAVPSDPQNLFQGHDYAHWIDVLTHERDLSQVMQAILAVQALADTPQQQLEAASETLRLARRWGGRVYGEMKSPSQISPDTAPSEVYMSYLDHIFTRYPIDAALEAINQELIDGNDQSVWAAGLLCGQTMSRYSTQFDGPAGAGWLEQDDADGSRAALASSLAANLLKHAPPLAAVPPPEARTWFEELRENAIQIHLLLGNPITDNSDLSDYIKAKFKVFEKITDEQTVRVGIQMAAADDELPKWTQLIHSILSTDYQWTEIHGPSIFQSVADAAPGQLLAAIETQLEKFAQSPEAPRPSNSSTGGFSGGGFWGVPNQNSPLVAINASQTAWKSALEFFSETAEPSQRTVDRIAALQKSMIESKRDVIAEGQWAESDMLASVDAAIEKVTERFTARHGKPPQPTEQPAEFNASREPQPKTRTDVFDSPGFALSNSTVPANPHLYRGKPIAHYLAVMNNDADVSTVADAIAAVELLSRGTELRELSATATLALARRWGSLVQTGSKDTTTAQGQSDVFMGTLLSTFPAYFPEPAFHAIASEVENANSRSLATCAYLLNHYRLGWFQQSSSKTRCREALAALNQQAGDPVSAETLAKIETALVDAVAELDRTVFTYDSEAEMRLKTALWIHLAINDDVAADSWAQAYVLDELNQRMQNWSPENGDESHQMQSFGGGTANVWGLDEDHLLATLRIGGLDDRTKRYLCDVWTDKWFRVRTPRSGEVFEFLKTEAKASLLANFEAELQRLAVPVTGEWMYGSSGYSPLDSDQAVLLTDTDSALAMTLPLYAAEGRPTRYHIGVLRTCLARLEMSDIEHRPNLTLQPIKTAIAQLSERYEQIHGKRPPEDDGPIADPGDLPAVAPPALGGAAEPDQVRSETGLPMPEPTAAVRADAETAGPVSQAADETSTSNATAAQARLYQGKTLAEWIIVMQVEQDMNTVGEAMRAAELLTRGSDERLLAATETLKLARKWGGFIIGSTGGQTSYRQPQSQLFMGYFTEVFRYYLPEPGLELLAEESAGGNTKSRLACILCLEDYVTGLGPNEMAVTPENSLQSWSEANPETAEAVFKLLTNAVDENARAINAASKDSLGETKYLAYLETVLLRYALLLQIDLTENDVVRERVEAEIERTQRDLATDQPIGTSIWGTSHLSEMHVYAAIALAQANAIDANWNFLSSELTSISMTQTPTLFDDAFARLQKHASQHLVQSTLAKLEQVRKDLQAEPSELPRNFFGGTNPSQSILTAHVWKRLLPAAVASDQNPEPLYQLLLEVRTLVCDQQKEASGSTPNTQILDTAIEELAAKVSQQ